MAGHEIQPSLPLFPDYAVSYVQLQPMRREDFATGHTASEIIELPVDEIDLLADQQLREALWKKHAKNYMNAHDADFVVAFDDDTFSHVAHIPRRPLEFPHDQPFSPAESVPTVEGDDQKQDAAAREPTPDMFQPTSSLIRRILGR